MDTLQNAPTSNKLINYRPIAEIAVGLMLGIAVCGIMPAGGAAVLCIMTACGAAGVVSRANRSCFGSDLCFLPPFVRRIFHCFRPDLPITIPFWVKSGSSVRIQSCKQLTRTKDSDYSLLDHSLWEFLYALRISSGRSLGTCFAVCALCAIL